MDIFFFYFYWLSFFGFGCSLRWLELLRIKLFFRVTHNRIVFQDFVLNLIILVVGFFIAHWSLPAGFSFFKSCILLLGRRIWDEIVTSCRCKSWISLDYGHLSFNLVRYERGAGRRERGDRVDTRDKSSACCRGCETGNKTCTADIYIGKKVLVLLWLGLLLYESLLRSNWLRVRLVLPRLLVDWLNV